MSPRHLLSAVPLLVGFSLPILADATSHTMYVIKTSDLVLKENEINNGILPLDLLNTRSLIRYDSECSIFGDISLVTADSAITISSALDWASAGTATPVGEPKPSQTLQASKMIFHITYSPRSQKNHFELQVHLLKMKGFYISDNWRNQEYTVITRSVYLKR